MRNVITMLLVLLVIAVVGVLPLTKAVAGYDSNPQPKLAEDIIDSLIVVPKNITDRFGSNGERVRLIYNIALLRDVVIEQNKRIVALEALVLPKPKTKIISGLNPGEPERNLPSEHSVKKTTARTQQIPGVDE